MKIRLRYLSGIAIAVACTAAAIFLFDWSSIGATFRNVRLGFLAGSGFGLLIAASVLRGLRWLVMLGLPLTPAAIAWSALANGAAAGLGSVTPMKIGEALKIRLGPGAGQVGWQPGVSAFMVERGLDLSGVIGVLLGGLVAHAGHAWAMPLLLLAPIPSGLLLVLFSTHLHWLPWRMRPFLVVFGQRRRVFIASVLTVPLWLLNLGLWWCAAAAINVRLGFSGISILLGSVVLASVASMAPSGLGILELGTRGIMLWLGFSVGDAEGVAVGLRLLTPLLVTFGLVCVAPLALRRKFSG